MMNTTKEFKDGQLASLSLQEVQEIKLKFSRMISDGKDFQNSVTSIKQEFIKSKRSLSPDSPQKTPSPYRLRMLKTM
jgi:hypothetical protein